MYYDWSILLIPSTSLGRFGGTFMLWLHKSWQFCLCQHQFSTTPVAKRPLEHNTKHKHTKHTTTNMSRHCPTLQRLCHLSPWQHPPWTHILAPLIPKGPYKARSVMCALVAVCSFVWGAKMQHIKNDREGCDLGLRWPSFGQTTQQPTKSRHSR